MKFPELSRIDGKVGKSGIFLVKLYHTNLIHAFVVASNDLSWDHVSVTLKMVNASGKIVGDVPRCPTWEEMCKVKDVFFDPEEPAFQLHPPKSMYVSTHPYCLHLWRQIGKKMVLPHPMLVGFLGDDKQKLKKK